MQGWQALVLVGQQAAYVRESVIRDRVASIATRAGSRPLRGRRHPFYLHQPRGGVKCRAALRIGDVLAFPDGPARHRASSAHQSICHCACRPSPHTACIPTHVHTHMNRAFGSISVSLAFLAATVFFNCFWRVGGALLPQGLAHGMRAVHGMHLRCCRQQPLSAAINRPQGCAV